MRTRVPERQAKAYGLSVRHPAAVRPRGEVARLMSAPNRRRAIPVRKEGVPRALGLPGGVRHCTRHLAGACAAQCARAAGAAAPAAEDAQWSRAALTPPTSSGPETNGPISACWSSPGPLSMATLDRDTLPRLQLVKLRPTWYRFPHNGLRSHGNGAVTAYRISGISVSQ